MRPSLYARPGASRRGRPSKLVVLTVAAAACAVPSLASAQSVINNWAGENGAFGDATKWFDGIVPTADQIALIVDGGTGANTTATISAGDNFTVRELNIGNGEPEFAGAFALTGSGTLVQTGGTITANDWFTVGRPGDPAFTGTYNFSGGVANKAGGGIFGVGLFGTAGASVVNMSGNAVFNNTGTGDTRIGANIAGGTLNMSGSSQLNHTQAEFKVGDFFESRGFVNLSDTAQITVNNRAIFIGIFGGDGTVVMNGSSKIIKTGAVGQFAICDSFGQGGDPTNGTVTMHDNAQIDIATGPGEPPADEFRLGGEFWVGNGFNGTGTLNMDGNALVTVRNQIMVGRSNSNGTINLGGNASIVVDERFSPVSIGNFQAGKGVVNQTGGTFDIRTGFLRMGDGENDAAFGTTAQRSEYNMSGGIARFGAGMDIGAFGEASGLFNLTGGAAEANFMFLTAPVSRSTNELRVGGGSLTINGSVIMAASQNANAIAVANVSGGTFRQSVATGSITVGDQGAATLTLSGTGRVEAAGFVLLGSRNASEGTVAAPITTGTGTINLNGGTLQLASLRKGLGNAAVNFNGGVLQAAAAEADFIRGFAAAELVAGANHAVIDSNGFAVTSAAVLSGTGGLTKRGAGTLELTAVQSYAGRTRVEGGTLRLNAASGVSRVTALEFGGTTAAPAGTLDVAGKPLVIDYAGTADLNAVRLALAAGAAANSTGGITSAGLPSNQAVGYADRASLTTVPAIFGTVDATSILLRTTLRGDTNLDGEVRFADLVSLAQNYNGTGRFWVNGDFNYDGTVTFPDLVSLAQNYNGTLNAAQMDMVGADFAGDFEFAQSLVPEPTTLAVVAGVGGMALRRRRPVR